MSPSAQPHFPKHMLQSAVSYEQGATVCHKRLPIIISCFLLCYATIIFRLCDVAFFDYTTTASDPFNRASIFQFKRNNITDRNGVLLATNLKTASLYANPSIIIDADEASQALATVFPELNTEDLLSKLQSDKKFIWIKRNLTPNEQYKANRLGIPGLFFEEEERRIYPHGSLLSHLVGYTDIDGEGLSGIEKEFNAKLKNVYNATQPLALSVDVNIQHIVHQSLAKAMKTYRAAAATGIVLKVENGEVLAMASLPDFDPHFPAHSTRNENFNRATFGVYEMGSTLKPFTLAMALDSGSISLNDSYDVSTPISVANYTIKDLHQKKKNLTIPEILTYSSNIGTAKIALETGSDIQQHYLERLGLLSPLPIEIPEKSSPLLPETWRDINTMTISYGYGLAVTPIHIAQATATLVNGGYFYPATLLLQSTPSTMAPDKILSDKTTEYMQRLLRQVVQQGTGKKADAQGYLVGGKTGTAKKLNDQGQYSEDKTLSSFVGVFPMNNPQYVVMVVLDEPKGKLDSFGFNTGGVTSAPVVKEIITHMAPILNISPVIDNLSDESQEFWAHNDIGHTNETTF